MITQRELEAYRSAKKLAESCDAAMKDIRDDLVSREGEEVEPGPLTMKVGERGVRSFSYDAMVDLFGRAEADRIRDLIPEKRSKVLSVALA